MLTLGIIGEHNLQEKYLNLIKKGIKTVEGRINDGKFAEYKKGDIIKFVENKNPQNFILCKILRVHHYKTFEEMLQKEGLGRCLPGVKIIEEGVNIYRSFTGYIERGKLHGVLAFTLSSME